MKKFFISIFLFLCFFSLIAENIIKEDTKDFLDDNDYLMTMEDGFVPNEKIAEEIADVILTSIYGDKILTENKPYKITLKDGIWFIEGTLKNNDDLSSCGGIPYIKIRKSDGAILGVIHTK